MKKYIYLTLGLLSMGSCDVLEPEPQTSLDANAALVDAASAEGILLGAYSTMQADPYYGVEYVLNNDLIADNAKFQGFYDSQLELDQKSVPITNLWVTDAWRTIYRVINISNLLLDGVDGIEDPALDKEAVKGEAYAIRALAYFDLLRVYGAHYDMGSPYGLPLLLQSIPDNDFNQIPDLARSSVAETYDQILSDLDNAIALLSNDDPGRMNYWSSVALRARVKLYMKDYAGALADADLVISEGPYVLEDSLDDVFYTTEPSGESIFEVEFNDQDQSAFNTYTIRRDEYNVDEDLLNSFEAGDLRKNYFTVARNRNRTGKYLDNTNSNNAKVLRLAEMYLIRSEAAAMNSGNPDAGLADLNILRERAGLLPLLAVAGMNEYIDALLYERRAELNFEGHRFFDLVRFDLIDQVLGMEDYKKVFPIPRTELQVTDNLEQNPGYATE